MTVATVGIKGDKLESVGEQSDEPGRTKEVDKHRTGTQKRTEFGQIQHDESFEHVKEQFESRQVFDKNERKVSVFEQSEHQVKSGFFITSYLVQKRSNVVHALAVVDFRICVRESFENRSDSLMYKIKESYSSAGVSIVFEESSLDI